MNSISENILSAENIFIFVLKKIKNILGLGLLVFILFFSIFMFIDKSTGPKYDLNLYIDGESETLTYIESELGKVLFFFNLFENYEFSSKIDEIKETSSFEKLTPTPLDLSSNSLKIEIVFEALSNSYFIDRDEYENFSLNMVEEFNFDLIKLSYIDPKPINNFKIMTFDKNYRTEAVLPKFEKTISNLNQSVISFYLKEWDSLILRVGNFINQVESSGLDETLFKTLNFQKLKLIFRDFTENRKKVDELKQDFFDYDFERLEIIVPKFNPIISIIFLLALSFFISLTIVVFAEFYKKIRILSNES